MADADALGDDHTTFIQFEGMPDRWLELFDDTATA
jgi:hypothetical protein